MNETRTPRSLLERLKNSLEEAEEWMKGNTEARVTEISEGVRIGPTMMTRAELDAQRAACASERWSRPPQSRRL